MTTKHPNDPHVVLGDPAPPLRLHRGNGDAVDLKDQRYAGDIQVLWFAAAFPPGRSGNDAPFTAIGAHIFRILTREPGPGDLADDDLFRDPDGAAAAALGLETAGMAVIAPGGRLAWSSGDADPGRALAMCREIHAASTADRSPAHAPVLVIPDVLEPALCTEVIDYWAAGGEKMSNTVASNASASQPNDRFKVRDDVVLLDERLFTAVKDRLMARVFPEMFKAMQFKTANMEALRIGCYDAAAGGTFRRHRDNATRFSANRKFAMSLNLSSDYAGGELRFPEYGRMLYRPAAGAAVIFSCSLLHEALPVTAGRRFAVFSFFTDAEGEARNRQLQADTGLKGFGMTS